MLDEAEYASDTDESDEDYKPDVDGENAPSEVESDGEPENDDDTDSKRRSRKRATSRASPVTTKRSKKSEEEASKTIEKDELIDDEDDNEDALWASFLGNAGQTAEKPKSNTKQVETNLNRRPTSTSNGNTPKVEKVKASTIVQPEKKEVVTEIFEFAGEKVEVQKEIKVRDERPATSNERKSVESNIDGEANKSEQISAFNKPRSGGGLSSVLGQLGKKNKLSVLEKSKIDWSGFKRNEGIDEELQTHNKGRDGYLERQDFLQRTDLRQFEIEKNMRRATRRK